MTLASTLPSTNMTYILVVLCTILKARYYPPTIPDLREKLERSEDAERTAQDFIEQIEQHGAHGWVDPLIEKVGPTIQLQLEDLANFTEILKKFVNTLAFIRDFSLPPGVFLGFMYTESYRGHRTDQAVTASMNGEIHTGVQLP
jgi:hypothetical protein